MEAPSTGGAQTEPEDALPVRTLLGGENSPTVPGQRRVTIRELHDPPKYPTIFSGAKFCRPVRNAVASGDGSSSAPPLTHEVRVYA
jgi:hypothetical protein